MITARDLHAKLSILGARHLYDLGCELVTCEFSTSMNGLPGDYVFDALGLDFKTRQVRIVEAKTSRGDFLGDDCIGGGGYSQVADYCWLICPDHLIDVDELPSHWGLLYYCQDVADLTYLEQGRRRRRRVRAPDIKAARTELAERYRKTLRPGEGCLLARRARRITPVHPLSARWDDVVRGVGRKLTRGALGIKYIHGKPVPQPVECLEL